MKVIVGYYNEKEIEIDDAFAPCADPILTIYGFSTLLPMRFWTRSAVRLKTMTTSVVSRMKMMNILMNSEGALRVLFLYVYFRRPSSKHFSREVTLCDKISKNSS